MFPNKGLHLAVRKQFGYAIPFNFALHDIDVFTSILR